MPAFKRTRGQASGNRKKRRSVRSRRSRGARAYTRAALNVRTGGFLGLEKKFRDTYLTDKALVATLAGSECDPATFNCLNAIAEGSAETERDGRKAVIRSCHLRGEIERLSDAGTTNGPAAQMACWVALVLDTQTNGAQLNAEDVFTVPASGQPHLPLQNLQYSSRFKVLKMKRMTFDAPNMVSNGEDQAGTHAVFTGGQVKSFDWYIPMNMGVTFKNSTPACADIIDNSLHVIAVASGVTAPNALRLSYSARVRFVG